jgi:predicted transport protein
MINHLNETRSNTFGSTMQIIEFENINKIKVRFNNGFETNCSYRAFKQGNVRNKFERTHYNIGYEGIGEAKPTIEGKRTLAYSKWKSMLQRCYDPKFHLKRESYKNCLVDSDWHNFQNFAKWFKNNFYQIENEVMHLDKDILVKNNKIYSSKTCLIVPHSLNLLFNLHSRITRELPTGVYFDYKEKKYKVDCSFKNKTQHLGSFQIVEEALQTYNNYKQSLLSSFAENYKEIIPIKVYEALLNYKFGA